MTGDNYNITLSPNISVDTITDILITSVDPSVTVSLFIWISILMNFKKFRFNISYSVVYSL